MAWGQAVLLRCLPCRSSATRCESSTRARLFARLALNDSLLGIKAHAKYRRIPRLPERETAEEAEEAGRRVAAGCDDGLSRGPACGGSIALPALAAGPASIRRCHASARRVGTRMRAVRGGEADPRGRDRSR